MSIDQNTIELLREFLPKRDWVDYVSVFSVPILSLTALFITWFFSRKQIKIAELEYKYKREIEKFDVYKKFEKIFIDTKFHNIKADTKILEYETTILIFDQVTIAYYYTIKLYINNANKSNSSFNEESYINLITLKLETLLSKMRDNMPSFYQ